MYQENVYKVSGTQTETHILLLLLFNSAHVKNKKLLSYSHVSVVTQQKVNEDITNSLSSFVCCLLCITSTDCAAAAETVTDDHQV